MNDSTRQSTLPPLPAGGERPLSLAPSAFWIGWFSFREMARRRRLIFLTLVMLVPAVVAWGWRVFDTEGLISAELLLANMSAALYVHLLVAMISLAVGISAIGEQVEEGIILYYWTRPIGRSAIYIGRLLAAQMVASSLLVLSVVVCFVVMVAGNFGILTLDFLKLYVGMCAVIVVGAFVYTAIFALLGTVLKRPLMPSLVFAFGWEYTAGHAPIRLQELTVVFHLRNLIRNTAPGTGDVSNFLTELRRLLTGEAPVPEWESAVTLLVVLVVSTALGIWGLRRKEIFK